MCNQKPTCCGVLGNCLDKLETLPPFNRPCTVPKGQNTVCRRMSIAMMRRDVSVGRPSLPMLRSCWHELGSLWSPWRSLCHQWKRCARPHLVLCSSNQFGAGRQRPGESLLLLPNTALREA